MRAQNLLSTCRHVCCAPQPGYLPAFFRKVRRKSSAQSHMASTSAEGEPWVLWNEELEKQLQEQQQQEELIKEEEECSYSCIKGRGEYVRLVFEDAGVPYVDAGVKHGFQAVVDFAFKGGNPGFPVRAPPIIQKGDFSLCATNVIMSYLNDKYGWGPENPEDRAHVDQILAVVTDAVAEGRLAFHPKDFYKTHKMQVEESKPYIVQYGTERLPKYMQHFEAILQRNGGTPSVPGFLVASSRTAADLAVYHWLAAAEQHYKQYYEAVEAPICKAFMKSIEERPLIKAYLASDRCQPWDADSMM